MLHLLTKGWQSRNIETYFFPIHWRDGKPFQPKLTALLQTIDALSLKYTLSLVGTSAGGSLACNAFASRRGKIHKAINVCGRLRAGNHTLRSLERMAKTSIAFKESVLEIEKIAATFNADDHKRLMTIRPLFGDEVVPGDTVDIPGAHNRYVWSVEHALSIGVCLFFSREIIEFIKS